MREGHVMTAKRNTAANFPAGRKPTASSASGAPASASRKNRLAGAAVLGVAALAAAGALAGGAARADATVLTNCAPTPGTCSYPGAATTGVPAGTTLKQVPAQVTTGGNFGISLTHTAGVTIANSTISGQNATTGRVSYAIDDVYGDSTGTTIKANNISDFRTAVQISTGLAPGDHTNGFYVGGGTQPLTIQNNTIFDSLGQTDAINLDAATPGPAAPVANKTIKNNLLAGGSYTIYAGAASGSPTSGIVITGNRFGQNYYPQSGQYGPVTYFNPTGTGNTWTGNIWDTTGQAVPSS